jgi:hypothetical protein
MARRLQQTLADYVVIAISPALIMLLVGSLMFFLLRVFYQGDFQERLHWVMTCFVFAAVLIARISIEQGFERAAPFGAALAILVGIAANRFMEYHGSWIDSYSWIINFTVIGIVWWCVHKLTWDCTVIDDAEDASGEGLMQIVGLESTPDERNDAGEERLAGTTTREVPAGFWQRYVERQHRPHAPGVWVVYFSLAALPLFGLGQWLIPVSDTAGRKYVFWLLFIYVASGLGLLLTTSFLGLRRYLRQRRIEMPTMMANLWLSTGGGIIAALLLAAALLPRPSAEFAISQLPVTLGSPQQSASRMAPLDEDGTKDDHQGTAAEREPSEGKPGDQPSPEGTGNQPGGQFEGEASGSGDGEKKGKGSGESKQSAGEGEPSEQSKGSASSKGGEQGGSNSKADHSSTRESKSAKGHEDSKSNSSKSGKAPESEFARNVKKYRETQEKIAEEYGDKSKDQQPESAGAKQPESNEPPDESENESLQVPEAVDTASGYLLTVLKWTFYGLFALGVLFALWHYRREVLAAIYSFLDELRAFWQGLFGGKRIASMASDEVTEIRVPTAPFASFADPFTSGTFGRTPTEELVRYSFEAFEAWSREHGCPRGTDQTPHELARDVARLNSHIAADARNLAELYAKAAFGRGGLPDTAPEQLRQLWLQMTRREAISTS